MKKRIWELDAARGICILGMIVVHFIYDLGYLYRYINLKDGGVFEFLSQWGGIVFFLISGICATLGTKPVHRGLIVLFCGMLCTAVTLGMYLLGLQDAGIIIYFGVLHCLGSCMLLWWLLRKLSVWALGITAAGIIGLGLWLSNVVLVDFPWLVPLGFLYPGFATSDYFPILPYLGYFLAGAVLGRTLYRSKQTLLPGIDPKKSLWRMLCFVGRWSLPIYLLHQPVITAIMELLAYII